MKKTDLTLTRALESEHINRLRKAAGLPTKKIKFSNVSGVEVAINPDTATVTSYRETDEFVRINLNGGDSEAYYHPVINPEILYNFKGEPNYHIKDLDPDYYKKAKERAKEVKLEQANEKSRQVEDDFLSDQQKLLTEQIESDGKFYFAFNDRTTDQYFVGYHDFGENRNDFQGTSSKAKIRDYLAQHGLSNPKIIETWNYVFDPTTTALFDPENKIVNKFDPSSYMRNAKLTKRLTVPSNIRRLIKSALGDDPEMIEHFLNWLACIFQFRCKTGTSFIWQGTTGTGKGMLIEKVIRPLIGENHCRIVTLANLKGDFNAFLDTTLVLFIDEVDTDQLHKIDELIPRLKNMITEPRLAIRALYTELKESRSYLNIIMASNKLNSMRIEANDRRFNVCPRQEKPLFKPGEEKAEFVKMITNELPRFADYLRSREASLDNAAKAIENDAKRLMQAITQAAIEEVIEALKNGNLAFFIDHAPIPIPHRRQLSTGYRGLMHTAVCHAESGTRHFLKIDPLREIVDRIIGDVAVPRGKFGKYLLRFGLEYPSGPTRIDNDSVRGYGVKWQATKQQLVAWKKDFPSPPGLQEAPR